MGLADKQKLLARLYTDKQFRENFFASPASAAEAHGLTTEEAKELALLDPKQVGFFAVSLHNKRLQEVRALLPLTNRALGHRFAESFRQYADSYVPHGIQKHREDALHFASFLEKNLRAEDKSAWVLDLISYEASWLKVTASSPRLVVRRLRHDVRLFMREASAETETTSPVRRPFLAIWFRLSPASRVRHALFPLTKRSQNS